MSVTELDPLGADFIEWSTRRLATLQKKRDQIIATSGEDEYRRLEAEAASRDRADADQYAALRGKLNAAMSAGDDSPNGFAQAFKSIIPDLKTARTDVQKKVAADLKVSVEAAARWKEFRDHFADEYGDPDQVQAEWKARPDTILSTMPGGALEATLQNLSSFKTFRDDYARSAQEDEKKNGTRDAKRAAQNTAFGLGLLGLSEDRMARSGLKYTLGLDEKMPAGERFYREVATPVTTQTAFRRILGKEDGVASPEMEASKDKIVMYGQARRDYLNLASNMEPAALQYIRDHPGTSFKEAVEAIQGFLEDFHPKMRLLYDQLPEDVQKKVSIPPYPRGAATGKLGQTGTVLARFPVEGFVGGPAARLLAKGFPMGAEREQGLRAAMNLAVPPVEEKFRGGVIPANYAASIAMLRDIGASVPFAVESAAGAAGTRLAVKLGAGKALGKVAGAMTAGAAGGAAAPATVESLVAGRPKEALTNVALGAALGGAASGLKRGYMATQGGRIGRAAEASSYMAKRSTPEIFQGGGGRTEPIKIKPPTTKNVMPEGVTLNKTLGKRPWQVTIAKPSGEIKAEFSSKKAAQAFIKEQSKTESLSPKPPSIVPEKAPAGLQETISPPPSTPTKAPKIKPPAPKRAQVVAAPKVEELPLAPKPKGPPGSATAANKAWLAKGRKYGQTAEDLVAEAPKPKAPLPPELTQQKSVGAMGGDVIQRVREAVAAHSETRKVQDVLAQEALAQKFGRISKMRRTASGVEGARAMGRARAGKLPKYQREGLQKIVAKEDIDQIYDMVTRSGSLTDAEMGRAHDALGKVFFKGEVLQPNEVKLLKGVFPEDFVDEVINQKPGVWQRIINETIHFMGLPREMMATMDLSAPLRQGMPMAFAHPKEFAQNIPTMFKAAFSEKNRQKIMRELAERETFGKMRNAKLALTIFGDTNPSMREEVFAARIAEKIWGLKPIARFSRRGYDTFLAKFRADSFDAIVKSEEAMRMSMRAAGHNVPELNAAFYRDVAKFVNAYTGRGHFGKRLEGMGLGSSLSTILFSPRFQASRINILSDVLRASTWTGKTAIHKARRRALISSFLTGNMVLGMAAAAGLDVGTDPTSADFGKIKIGKTRIDIWAGFSFWPRLIGQLIRGYTTSSITGKRSKLGTGYGEKSAWDLVMQAVESRQNPTISMVQKALDMAVTRGEAKDWEQRPITPHDLIYQTFTPLILQDLVDIVQTDPKLAPLVLYTFFGGSIQTYPVHDKPMKPPSDTRGSPRRSTRRRGAR